MFEDWWKIFVLILIIIAIIVLFYEAHEKGSYLLGGMGFIACCCVFMFVIFPYTVSG